MTAIEQFPVSPSAPPAGLRLHSWYCPALSAFCGPDEVLPAYWQHLLRFPWVPLYAAEDAALPAFPEGWTLRAYYAPEEKGFYASHRTMSDKTAKSRLVELYAPPGAYGNDGAAHVPPKRH